MPWGTDTNALSVDAYIAIALAVSRYRYLRDEGTLPVLRFGVVHGGQQLEVLTIARAVKADARGQEDPRGDVLQEVDGNGGYGHLPLEVDDGIQVDALEALPVTVVKIRAAIYAVVQSALTAGRVALGVGVGQTEEAAYTRVPVQAELRSRYGRAVFEHGALYSRRPG